MQSSGRTLSISLAMAAAAMLTTVMCVTAPAAALEAPEVRIERSHRDPPGWTRRTPEADSEYLYFVGRATGAATLEAAETDAAADAIRQIVTMLGLDAGTSYDRIRSEADLLLDDRISLAGESMITGLKRLETYYEREQVIEREKIETRYNAHLLARYPRGSLERETSRLEQRAGLRVREAESLLVRAGELQREGALTLAWGRLSRVLEIARGPAVRATAADLAAMDRVRRRALEMSRELSLLLRRLDVRQVSLESDDTDGEVEGQEGHAFTEALSQALLSQGFQPGHDNTEGSPARMPQVVAACRNEGASRLDSDFHFSRWTASIQVLDPRDDSVIISRVYTAKGFGPDPVRAGLDACRKMRVEVFETFARQARETFDTTFGNGG